MDSTPDPVQALLSSGPRRTDLPDPAERQRLRTAYGLTRTEVAQALSVARSTVAGWESGRSEPQGATRAAYARLLDGMAEQLASADAYGTGRPPDALQALRELVEAGATQADITPGFTYRDLPVGDWLHDQLTAWEELPGEQRERLAALGFRPPAASAPEPVQPAQAPAAQAPEPAQPVEPVQPRPAAPRRARRGEQAARPTELAAWIADRVEHQLREHGGDLEAATAALVHKAIPDAMELWNASRKGAFYDPTLFPELPPILSKQSKHEADQIWEARPKWRNRHLAGRHRVTVLDMNAAYLSALKTHLPIGALQHSVGGDHDRKRAGVHLITPPAWEHEHLPNPLGARDEPGRLWVGEPTLRLMQRLATERFGALSGPPVIHESWTAGASESLLEKFRETLADARTKAVAEGDTVTVEYIKAMYSKFVSTMGESNFNRDIYRQDWMHLIRSQAFANLWYKAFKADQGGLAVVAMTGTDELHVTGDWRQVFPEGRQVSEVKVKDTYELVDGRIA